MAEGLDEAPLPLSFEAQKSRWRLQNPGPMDPRLGRMVSRPLMLRV